MIKADKMKIAFINPPVALDDEFGNLKRVRNIIPSLGIGYLAAVARNNSFSVKIYDCPVEQVTYSELLNKLRVQNPDIISYSATTLSIGRAIYSAKMVKENFPWSVLMIGGPHVTALPRETMHNGVFDIAVIGEGEVTFLELIKALRDVSNDTSKLDFETIDGIIYRKGNEFFVTKPREFIKDLSLLPLPARDLYPPLSSYHPTPASFRKLPLGHLLTSRGCPYLCIFCDRKIFGTKYRKNSPERVAEEIEELIKKYGAKEIKFYDDIFILDKNRVFKIFELIRKKNLKFPWTCHSRIDNLDRKLLREMRKMGCWQILFGMESGDQENLKFLGKNFTLDKVRDTVNIVKREGFSIRADFMVGFPGETKNSLRKTAEFAKSLNVDVAHFNVFTPFPGTELYQIALQEGNILHKDYNSYRMHSAKETHLAYMPEDFTEDELKKMIVDAYKDFYLRPKYILKQALSIRSSVDLKRYLDGFKTIIGMK